MLNSQFLIVNPGGQQLQHRFFGLGIKNWELSIGQIQYSNISEFATFPHLADGPILRDGSSGRGPLPH